MKLLNKIREIICGKQNKEVINREPQFKQWNIDDNKGEFLGTLKEMGYDLRGFSNCIVDRGLVYRKIDITK